MNGKVWFLAAGKKKVGPMSTHKVLQRVAAGRVPDGTLAWKEGMTDWLPLEEIDDLASAETIVSGSDAEAQAAKPAKKKRSSSKGKVKAIAGAAERHSGRKPKQSNTAKGKAEEAEALPLSYVPLYRIERADVWRSFGLGLDRRRVKLTLAVFGLTVLVGGLFAGIGAVASMAHPLLALPFAFLGGVASYVLGCLGLGAISYATRCQLQEQEPPTVREALAFAKSHAGALCVTPLALSVAWIVPLVALVLLTLLVKIPYLGPVGTGVVFGVHLALSAATFFLLLTAGIGSLYTPLVVGFEETGIPGTFRVLMDFVKRSTARVLFWGALPSLAQVPFSGVVLAVAALVLAVPVGLTFAMAGGPEIGAWLQGFQEAPVGGLAVGAVPMALWIAVFASGAVAILASVQNAMLGLLYLGGRKGNDELISRDAYRSESREQRAGTEG